MKLRTLMKIYILSFLSVIFLGSCSTTYFYSVMNSKDPYVQKNGYGEFVVEGDSLNIIYRFHGENAPVSVGVKNKTTQPIFIDWRRSGIIIDSVSSSYLPFYDDLDDPDRLISDKEGISIIMPKDEVSETMLELSNFKFHKIKDKYYNQSYIDFDIDGKKNAYPAIHYAENDSPIFLSTYLTVYLNEEDIHQPLVYENDFYMSELFKTKGISPKEIGSFNKPRGDMFFVRKENGHKFWNGVGAVVGVVAIVAVDVLIDVSTDY